MAYRCGIKMAALREKSWYIFCKLIADCPKKGKYERANLIRQQYKGLISKGLTIESFTTQTIYGGK